jgi:hypothetical protein
MYKEYMIIASVVKGGDFMSDPALCWLEGKEVET